MKEKETRLSVISQKLERLLTGYLDQVIDEQDYRNQKAKLLSKKKSLQEEMTFFHTSRMIGSHLSNEGGAPNSFGKFGVNPWDALRSYRILASSKPLSSILVGYSKLCAKPF